MSAGPENTQTPVRFGEEFELNLGAYELRRGSRVLKLERLPMDVLLFLIERRGHLVTREQIADKIWGKGICVDTDNNINGAIRKIRMVLNDRPEEPKFIQTITGRGYRFIAPVGNRAAAVAIEMGDADEADAVSPEPEKGAGRPEATPSQLTDRILQKRGLERYWPAAVVAAVLLTAIAGWLAYSRSRPQSGSERSVMVAVLPFDNLTGDSSQEYFSDGLTEEMISQLGSLDPKHLRIISGASAMHYKNSSVSPAEIGRELSVQYVLQGSVRRSQDKVRVTAQLVRTNDQRYLWSRQYDRELKDLLTLQGEIAREIADEIQLTLGNHRNTPSRSAPLPQENYHAYDLYLMGQYFLNKRTTADLQQAIKYFEEAIQNDPNYARAFAGLADCYALMGGYSGEPQDRFMQKARSAAMRALQIDDRLAEAHTALALIVQNYDWDWETAEKEFRRAIALNPSYATAHQWYAEHLMWRGRFDEAFEESERARQLDPLSLIIAADNGAILYFSRNYDGAIEKWRSVLKMDPTFMRAHLIAAAYVEKGMFREALAEDEEMRNRAGSGYWAWSAYINGRAGQTMQWRENLGELERWSKNLPLDPMLFSYAYVAIGDKGQALAWLEKAYAQHSNELVTLKVSPAYDRLRGDPRFQDLLRRIGLEN